MNDADLTLLVVDDSQVQLEYLQILLANHGFNLLTADNGQTAVDLARTHQPDLILMDLEMPGMSGLQAAHVLQSNPETRSIPIIMVSASQQVDDMEQAFIGGCCEYISKPIHLVDLLSKISSLTGQALAAAHV